MAHKKILASMAALGLFLASCSEKAEDTFELYGEDEYYDDGQSVNEHDLSDATPGSYAEFALSAGDRVHYDFDMYNVKDEYMHVIEAEAQWLNTYNNVRFIIAGHCDKRGTQMYNLGLGQRRANSHMNALIAQGVDPSRITTVSYGKERPVVEGDTDAAYAQNRVTIVHFD